MLSTSIPFSIEFLEGDKVVAWMDNWKQRKDINIHKTFKTKVSLNKLG